MVKTPVINRSKCRKIYRLDGYRSSSEQIKRGLCRKAFLLLFEKRHSIFPVLLGNGSRDESVGAVSWVVSRSLIASAFWFLRSVLHFLVPLEGELKVCERKKKEKGRTHPI